MPTHATNLARTLRTVPLLCACALAAHAQDTVGAPEIPARSWAVDCAANEVLVIQHPGSYLRYRMHVIDEKGDQLRDQIETPDGSVARLIQRDGRALTADEDSAERGRLNYLLATPSAFIHHIKNETSNRKMGADMLKLMPDAMLWTYAPNQPQLPTASPADPPLVVLDFKPNPKWSAPNMPSEALTGLEGRIWIDPRTRNLVHLEATLSHAVNIGFGMLAHIYPGGTVVLDQVEAQSHAATPRWIATHVVEQLTVRALMVKNVKQRLIYDTAGFQPVPTMTWQQAIKTLLDTPLPTH